jgi:phosphatidylglycerol:prolipoprotein diacylglycerol transferase
MLDAWQNLPLHLNPLVFTIGNFSLRWYSLGYLLAFLTIYFLLRHRLFDKNAPVNLTVNKLENILFFSFLGALLGGRFGYAILYNWSEFVTHPLKTILPFSSSGNFTGFYGMSFHGGLLGAIIAGWIVCKKYRLNFSQILNFIIPAFPLGYFWGRLGNFLNGELYGRLTESKIGMYFKDYPTELRHPSQLYEALGEGVVLFFILNYFSKQTKWQNKLFPLFLIFYGLIRFGLEFFRQPDPQLGFIAFGWLTMGQFLCLIMIGLGTVFLLINPLKFHKH